MSLVSYENVVVSTRIRLAACILDRVVMERHRDLRWVVRGEMQTSAASDMHIIAYFPAFCKSIK